VQDSSEFYSLKGLVQTAANIVVTSENNSRVRHQGTDRIT